MNTKLLSALVAIYVISILVSVNLHQHRSLPALIENKKEKEEEEFDKPLEFVRFQKEIRTRDGQVRSGYSAGYKMRELNKAKAVALSRSRAGGRTKSTVTFTERGPGNVPGRTRALFNIPDASGNVWLAGAATGGIWKTPDGGTNWVEKNDDLTTFPISSFAADKNATRIYAGTGEYISTLFSALGDGIFVSTDKGETWRHLIATKANDDFAIVTRIIVDPNNANTIVATTVPSEINPNDNTSAILRSTDGGESWTKVKEVVGIFEQVVATPGNFNVQYASQNGVGVWKSVDGGVTWNLSNTGMSPEGRLEITVSPVDGDRVFVSAEGTMSGTGSDLYVSDDAGITWSLVNVQFRNNAVNFLGGQGFYDNTIICDPFNKNIVYFGGVNLFRATLTSPSGTIDNFRIAEEDTESFLFLQSFADVQYDGARLTAGPRNDKRTVEIRFGTNVKQKAHRFLVPVNETSGVNANEYTYAATNGYVDVPFEVWDVTAGSTPRQLMVSFRDQNRNGEFDLVPPYLTADGTDYQNNSREYLYINNVVYNSQPHSSIATTGGQEYNLMYNIFPALADGAAWAPDALPSSKLVIRYNGISQYSASTITVADAYDEYDGKNAVDQTDLDKGVHPDHHTMIAVITNSGTKEYKIILGNDGGVFVSNPSATPGTSDGDWNFKGFGYNTGQFYGADKKPGEDQYIGGLQDNGTRISPAGEKASATSHYNFALGGDGFDVLWNSKDGNKVLGSIYYGDIYLSTNAGQSWTNAQQGLNAGETFPFITKLANSKDYPDRVFTVSSAGVYVSNDFGSSWSLTGIDEKFVTTSANLLDVEVSRANPNIVWAGSGMSNVAGAQRHLFVSDDGGTSFRETNNFTGVPMGSITKLASHPAEPHTAYALFSFSDAPKILRTTDLGDTWEDISGFGTGSSSVNGFPDVAVYCLYVRPDNPEILWAGTEIGIIESQDNGTTWTLLEDFPKVAVWDMKGQDDQIVIATHGRGIWTATLDAPQSGWSAGAVITAAGTTPKGRLAIRIVSTVSVDSLKIFMNTEEAAVLMNVKPGETDLALDIPEGKKAIHLISYREGVPVQSPLFTTNHITVTTPADSYSTVFNSDTDFALEGFALGRFTNSTRSTLHTVHPYTINTEYTAMLKTPVIVKAELPKLYYEDVAIVEPGADFVVAEATYNGLDWLPLPAAYDATKSSVWESAFSSSASGERSMLVLHEFDLTTHYSIGDTLLFRWKMNSGSAVTGWGWAIDKISIQEEPVGTRSPLKERSMIAYPNPSSGMMTLQYTLEKPSSVGITILDMSGRTIAAKNLGFKNTGEYRELIDLHDQPEGAYLLMLQTEKATRTLKVIVTRGL